MRACSAASSSALTGPRAARAAVLVQYRAMFKYSLSPNSCPAVLQNRFHPENAERLLPGCAVVAQADAVVLQIEPEPLIGGRDPRPHRCRMRVADGVGQRFLEDAEGGGEPVRLDLFTELGKPVVIHTRAADDDTLAALAGHDGTVVLHCFSSPHMLPTALERGWYVSFAGNATFPKAVDLRLAATQVPADRILAETDSPYLAPQPVRGKGNEPANVVHTLAALAQARGEEPDELERRIGQNAAECFSLP